ncbi:MAG TPA: MoxR family ATPase [Phycisphaerae bacterium]|jgi:MoxR-like ATPase|nr:MoxR family ATPase [Phycisphaerae bacterium]HOB73789.1 MoxR family ATPase [Phycisphaerae bacterium]HOJ56227.1 MoxR family ATPase [Phycisphaerae bacterium]HOL27125.1 MoxR family ATPase [Phycisphaerae bacterium]HPP21257.1 MoxR family ATPase [Phycisphaerae bacterium]
MQPNALHADDPLLDRLNRLRENIGRVFLGKPEAVTQVLVGLISRGHLLIEDVPGVGKTVLARSLARSLALSFSRIQLTPDLLPSDILGVSIYDTATSSFEFKKGPIFANIVLADEINRTTPRTQSALLEAMNESQVSVDGRTFRLDLPFLVIATQNPFEFEGTYFLPENQLDRFAVRIRIGYPARDVEMRILREQPSQVALEALEPVMCKDDLLEIQDRVPSLRIDDKLVHYALDLVEATRDHEHLEVGVSPRGTIALIRSAQAAALLAGRDYVVPDDIKSLFIPTCAHRVVSKSYLHDGHTVSAEQILADILRNVPVPG